MNMMNKEQANEVWWELFYNLIKKDFSKRKVQNPRYSARSYAKLLGLSPGAISEIRAGKRRLSLEACQKIAGKLKLSAVDRRKLMAALHQPLPKKAVRPSKEDALLIRDWVAQGILGMYEFDGFVTTEELIAQKLGVTIEEVRARIQMLIGRGLLQRDAQRRIYRLTEHWDLRGMFDLEEKIENEAVLFEVAKRAMRSPRSECICHTRSFPATRQILDFAKRELERISDQIDAMAEATDCRDELIRISFQAFKYDFEPKQDKPSN